MKKYLNLIFLICLASLAFAQQDILPYRDTTLSVHDRVEDLMQRMSMQEKVAQLYCLSGNRAGNLFLADETYDLESLRKKIPYSINQMSNPAGESMLPGDLARRINSLQKYFVEETRLGIPVIFHKEILHGFESTNATVFPQAIALASTWDTNLISRIYTVAAKEARSTGITQVLGPVGDIARDARWGRVEETYGEDPYLSARMCVEAVKALQGPGPEIDEEHVITTLKHFAGYGESEGGNNFAPSQIPERELREIHFPPFKAAVQEAGLISIMPAHQEIDGVPCHSNKWLLNEVLRGEWGFKGYTVSDYTDVKRLAVLHHVAKNKAEAAVLALEAGMDIELPVGYCYPKLDSMVKIGATKQSVIDTAVYRALKYKFLLGLFEDPYVNPERAAQILGHESNVPLARKAAQKSITLVKNENNTLPLDKKAIKKIAVIGPNADRFLVGGYSGTPKYFVTVLEGVTNAIGDEIEVTYAEGVKILEKGSRHSTDIVPGDHEKNLQRIKKALKVAKGADVIILALGGNEVTAREAYGNPAHLGDKTDLDLLGDQNLLVKALNKLGIPMVATIFHGSPIAYNYVNETIPAILECWYLGQESGNAVADVLFGNYNPGGKLPVSIPRSAGHIPAFYNHKPGARKGYLFDDVSPMYPFGYGLSYTTFALEEIELERDEIGIEDSVKVSVKIRNTGQMAGDEVVQLYIRDKVSSVTRPVKELKDFTRVHLKPGEAKVVELWLTTEKLAFFDINMDFVVEPGEFEVMVGTSSMDSDLKVRGLMVLNKLSIEQHN